MPYLVGIVLSVGVFLLGRCVGFDRERAFYPTVAIVVASYYVLFAALGASTHAVVIECAVMAMFTGASIAGFRSSAWFAVAALAGHGVFDSLRSYLIDNPGVPASWPAFCLAFDIGAAAGLAWLLRRGPVAPGAWGEDMGSTSLYRLSADLRRPRGWGRLRPGARSVG